MSRGDVWDGMGARFWCVSAWRSEQLGDLHGKRFPRVWWHMGTVHIPGCLSVGAVLGQSVGGPNVMAFPHPAAGSRVSQELRYTKEKLGEESVYTSQMLIQTPKREGENILTQEALQLHLEAALAASKVQVSLYGK